ncbi:hypothetical protein CL619_03075 [archaeon]|nr:hypothetical protein [archaeon]
MDRIEVPFSIKDLVINENPQVDDVYISARYEGLSFRGQEITALITVQKEQFNDEWKEILSRENSYSLQLYDVEGEEIVPGSNSWVYSEPDAYVSGRKSAIGLIRSAMGLVSHFSSDELDTMHQNSYPGEDNNSFVQQLGHVLVAYTGIEHQDKTWKLSLDGKKELLYTPERDPKTGLMRLSSAMPLSWFVDGKDIEAREMLRQGLF